MRPERLTTMAQQVLADAQSDAAARANAEIGGLHILRALLSDASGPGRGILTKCGADAGRIASITESELKRQPTTSSGAGTPGRQVLDILTRAEAESKKLGDAYVSSEHLLLALTETAGPAKEVLSLNAVDRKHVEAAIKEIRAASGVSNVTDQNAESTFEALKKYGIDLTERAQAGKLDPVIGRDEEIRRCMQVLSRRTKNNPVLIGEPGVGKTAIAEGLAQRIIDGDCPQSMKERRIVALDVGQLLAGA